MLIIVVFLKIFHIKSNVQYILHILFLKMTSSLIIAIQLYLKFRSSILYMNEILLLIKKYVLHSIILYFTYN